MILFLWMICFLISLEVRKKFVSNIYLVHLRNMLNFWTGYASITYSKIEYIPYNLMFITKFNDSSILITIILWDYLNLSLANEHVGDVTIPTHIIKYNQCCFRRISQSDCSIHIKLNYCAFSPFLYFRRRRTRNRFL